MIKLSKQQIEFLKSIYDPLDPVKNGYFECFKNELKTAKSLHKKGFIEFEDGIVPENDWEWFMAALTDFGESYVSLFKLDKAT